MGNAIAVLGVSFIIQAPTSREATTFVFQFEVLEVPDTRYDRHVYVLLISSTALGR